MCSIIVMFLSFAMFVKDEGRERLLLRGTWLKRMFKSQAKGRGSVDTVWGYLNEGKLHQACVPCFHAWSISVFIRDTRSAQTISYLSNSCLRIQIQLRCKFFPSSPYDLTVWGSEFLLELLLHFAIIFFPKVSFLYLSHSISLCNISIL